MRELRQNASRLLAEIEANGEPIEISNHGHPVARLVPIPDGTSASRADLIDAGILRPGRGDPLAIAPTVRPAGTPTTDELLAEDRGER